MPELPLLGGCMCGAVRYEVSAPPVDASYCHCTRCQRRTGSAAAASANTVPGSVTVVLGREHVARWQPVDGFAKAFCAQCGSALFWENPDEPDMVGVRMGTFDSDPGVRPSFHQFVDSAAAWEPLPDDGLPRYPGRRPA